MRIPLTDRSKTRKGMEVISTPERRRRPRMRWAPRIEPLEDRVVLSTLTVTNNSDGGPGSLRYEIGRAVAGDTINFANSLKGQTITLTSGPLVLGVNLTIDGPGADELTVSGGGTEGVLVVSAGVTATIDKLTIADGLAVQGGGIDNFGNLTVNRCALTGNTAVGGSGDSTTPDAANGGGIANEAGASLTLTHDLLTNNVAAASPGNDAFGGALLNLGSATVTACRFTGNQATGGGSTSYYAGSYGAGIESFDSSTLTASNCAFTANQSVAASGLFYGDAAAVDVEFGAVATITNTSFTDNVATGGAGAEAQAGAIFAEGCTLTLTTCSFISNQAIGGPFNSSVFESSAAFGGVMLIFPSTTVSLTNCTLIGNQAIGGNGATSSTSLQFDGQAGGGAIEDNGGSLSLTHCTLTGNRAVGGSGANSGASANGIGFGGGIVAISGATLSVTNSTLVDNVAQGGFGTADSGGLGIGGGIEDTAGGITGTGATLTMINTTLIGNQAIGGAGAARVPGGAGAGGALDISGTSTAAVTNSRFTGNLAQGGAGGAGANGGDGLGGGISVATNSFFGSTDTSSLSLSNSTLVGNIAQCGAGGSGANGGNGLGGGVFVGTGGSTTLVGTTIIANDALGSPAGSGGSDGDGIGGGLYVATGAGVSLNKTRVHDNFASTSNDDIYGSVTDL